jgi:hypothetical protein
VVGNKPKQDHRSSARDAVHCPCPPLRIHRHAGSFLYTFMYLAIIELEEANLFVQKVTSDDHSNAYSGTRLNSRIVASLKEKQGHYSEAVHTDVCTRIIISSMIYALYFSSRCVMLYMTASLMPSGVRILIGWTRTSSSEPHLSKSSSTVKPYYILQCLRSHRKPAMMSAANLALDPSSNAKLEGPSTTNGILWSQSRHHLRYFRNVMSS